MNSLPLALFRCERDYGIIYKGFSCIFNWHFWSFLTVLYVLCSFLYWNMLDRTVDAALAALTFPELKGEEDKNNHAHHTTPTQAPVTWPTTHLLSWVSLMPTSLGRPSKKVMSLAAR